MSFQGIIFDFLSERTREIVRCAAEPLARDLHRHPAATISPPSSPAPGRYRSPSRLGRRAPCRARRRSPSCRTRHDGPAERSIFRRRTDATPSSVRPGRVLSGCAVARWRAWRVAPRRRTALWQVDQAGFIQVRPALDVERARDDGIVGEERVGGFDRHCEHIGDRFAFQLDG